MPADQQGPRLEVSRRRRGRPPRVHAGRIGLADLGQFPADEPLMCDHRSHVGAHLAKDRREVQALSTRSPAEGNPGIVIDSLPNHHAMRRSRPLPYGRLGRVDR